MSEADLITVQEHMWDKLESISRLHLAAIESGHDGTARVIGKSVLRILGELRAVEAARCRF